MTNIAKNKKIKITLITREYKLDGSLRVRLGKSIIQRKKMMSLLQSQISNLNVKIIKAQTGFRMLDSSGLKSPTVDRKLLTIDLDIRTMEDEKKALAASLKKYSGMFGIKR